MENRQRRLALVTGASSGLGAAIARQLAAAEIPVILTGRNQSRLAEVAGEIEACGQVCWHCPADITRQTELLQLQEFIRPIGTVSLLINNAGSGRFETIENTSDELWEKTLAVNMTGAFKLSRLFIPGMKERGQGTVVYINSVAGQQAYSHSSAYCAAKFGLRGLADSLRREVSQDNIKIISIFPGAFDSPFWDHVSGDFPRAEMLSTDEVAATVVHAVTQPGTATLEDVVIRRTKGDL